MNVSGVPQSWPEPQALLTPETVRHFAELVREHGTDCWWRLSTEQLLPPRYRAEAGSWTRGHDTLDVWFDSGSSWASVLPRDPNALPERRADLFLEGSDQHRGWFLSSLLTASAVVGHAPYRLVTQRVLGWPPRGYNRIGNLSLCFVVVKA